MCNNTYIEKKKFKNSEEHRTTSLMLYASKILTTIVHKRIKRKI